MSRYDTTSKCRRCGRWLPRDEFERYPSGRLRLYCRECYRTPEQVKEDQFGPQREYRARLLKQGLSDCTECGKIKPLASFGKGHPHSCKKCNSKRAGEFIRNLDPEVRRTRQHEYRQNLNPKTKINLIMRHRMTTALKRAMISKTGSSVMVVEYIGCTVEQFKAYIESQFQKGMTWENHGVNGWHLDHVMPLASYDLQDEEDMKKAWHYSNLRPLWAKENRLKNATIPKQYQPRLLGT